MHIELLYRLAGAVHTSMALGEVRGYAFLGPSHPFYFIYLKAASAAYHSIVIEPPAFLYNDMPAQ